MATKPNVVGREFKVIASWHDTKLNGVDILDPPIHQRDNCFCEALAYSANSRLKVRRLKQRKGVQSYKILAPRGPDRDASGRHITTRVDTLWQCKLGGMPTSKPGYFKKLKDFKYFEGPEQTSYANLFKYLGLEDGDNSCTGGCFVAAFEVKSDYDKDEAGDEVYLGTGPPTDVYHAVSVCGLGEEIHLVHRDRDTNERVVVNKHWIYQNSYGPNWGLGKLGCDQVIKAWVPEI